MENPEAQKQELSQHEQEMIQKVDNKQQEIQTELNGDGELLAGKFKSVDDLAKSYKELEAKLGQEGTKDDNSKGKTEGDSDTSDTKEESKAGIPEDSGEAKEVVEGLGLDFNALTEEFVVKGELSEESYQSLVDKGIPKEVVDGYIEGQKHLAAKQVSEIQNIVGGADEYNRMIQWAADTLSPEQIESFNSSLGTNLRDTAVNGLYAQFTNAVGKAPNLIEGGHAPSGPSRYESKAQMVADMNDPRYSKDPAFRSNVMSKLARSSF